MISILRMHAVSSVIFWFGYENTKIHMNEKTRLQGRVFLCSGRRSNTLASILRDNRGRRVQVELVADASLDLVLLEPAAAIEKHAIRQIGERPVPECAEIGEAVFGEDP